MNITITELATRAASGDPAIREAAGDELVRLLLTGADDAFEALCGVARSQIFHFFSARISDDQDAFDLTEEVVAKLRKAFDENRLLLAHGARSFYEYVYTTARRDYVHYTRKRSRLLVVEPEVFDMTDRWTRQPSLEDLARSHEMYRWLRQATADIPGDLDLLMLHHVQELPRDEIIRVSGVSKLRFNGRLHEAKNKVIERFVCLFIARTRGVEEAGERKCEVLVKYLKDRVKPGWKPTQPFTTQVFELVKRHVRTCETCGEDYRDKKKRGLRKEFLLPLPFISMPDRSRDQAATVATTSAVSTATSTRPWLTRLGTKRTKAMIATGLSATAVVAILFAADGRGSSTPRDLGLPTPTTTTTSPPPTSTAAPQAPPTSSTTARPPSSPRPTPSTSTTPTPGPTPPTTTPTPLVAPPPPPPPPLQISLATSAAACSPADTCDPVPSCDTCSADYVGDCTEGVVLSFRTVIGVNRGPTELTVRWHINGTPVNTEPVSFSGTGQQQTWVGQATVLNTSSGPWTARLEVLTPRTVLSNTAQATITCTEDT